MWVTVRPDEIKKDKYKMVPHSFTKKVCGKDVCSNCGLMRLNNRLTQWCVKMGCENDLHPAYKSKCKSLSK